MSAPNLAARVCRACGQRSFSSFTSTAQVSRPTRLQTSSSTQTRKLSSTSRRKEQELHSQAPDGSQSTQIPPSLLSHTTTTTTTSPSVPPSSTTTTTTPKQPNPLPSSPPTLHRPEKAHNPYPSLPTTTTSSLPLITGTVASIHASTARVIHNSPIYDRHLRKHYNHTTHNLVHDPLSLLHVNDVITYSPFTALEKATRAALLDETLTKQEAEGKDTGRLTTITRKGFVVPPGKRLVMMGAKLEAINRKQRNTKPIRFVVREVVTPFGTTVAQRVAAGEQKTKIWTTKVAEATRKEMDGGQVKQTGVNRKELGDVLVKEEANDAKQTTQTLNEASEVKESIAVA